MVNMSMILFPCSQPTSMITPETQEAAGLREATPLPHEPHPPSGEGGVRTDDAEGVEGELLPQQVHALLQRRLGRLQKTGNISGGGGGTPAVTSSSQQMERHEFFCWHHLGAGWTL